MPASLDSLEHDYLQKASVPLDDAYSVPDSFERKHVPVGPNHQATMPVCEGRRTKVAELTGTYDVDANEERMMGITVIPMPDLSVHSCASPKDVGRIDCVCLDQASIRCVQKHVREERINLLQSLGRETFMNLGFDNMGEEVSLKWTKEEEDLFHEIVDTYRASLGRNFWVRLSAAFPSRTKKEIVSFYYNVIMLRIRAAQNRSRFNIDSDDDECPTSMKVGYYGHEASDDDDSDIESNDDKDFPARSQGNNCDDDGEDGKGDSGTDSDWIYIGNIGNNESDDKGNSADLKSQMESLFEPVQQVKETVVGMPVGLGVDDVECPTSRNVGFYGHEASDDDDSDFESNGKDFPVRIQGNNYDDDGEDGNGDSGTDSHIIYMGNNADLEPPVVSLLDPFQQNKEILGMPVGLGVEDESLPPFDHVDASPALQACGFRCDQSPLLIQSPPLIPGIYDFSCDTMERIYFSGSRDSSDWSPGYPTGPASHVDFSATSNSIEGFLYQATPDEKTKN